MNIIFSACLRDLVLAEMTANQQFQVTWNPTSCGCRASEYQVLYLAKDYCDGETSGILSWQTQQLAILPISGAFSRVEVSVTPRRVNGQTVEIGRPVDTSLDGITSGKQVF